MERSKPDNGQVARFLYRYFNLNRTDLSHFHFGKQFLNVG